jgi:nitrogen-specific signal transduction histidine kinase/tetratricopeptide (TPR) repeat protein
MAARMGRPDRRPLVALVALVLLPGVALALFGLRGLGEREDGLRAQYVATSTLVRDRLVAALATREQQLGRRLQASVGQRVHSADPAEVRDGLSALTAGQAWLKHPFVIRRDRLTTMSVHAGWTGRRDKPLAGFPKAAAAVAAAEAAEFRHADREAALQRYREALAAVPAAPAASAFLSTRIGRTLFNLHRYEEAIGAYREALDVAGRVLDQNGLPYAVIALLQMADAAAALGRDHDKAEAERLLLQYVVDHPWDLADGFASYLDRALAAAPAAPWTARGRALASDAVHAEWLIRDVAPRLRATLERDPADAQGYVAVALQDRPALIGYQATRDASGEFVVVGYAIDEFLQGPALEAVVGSLGLAGRETIAVAGVIAANRDEPALARPHPPLAEMRLFPDVPGWTVAVTDPAGRSVGQLVVVERWTYGAFVLGLVVVMTVGVVLIARASARAAELSRLRTEFVANVSHELKTPLALIRMFGETLESGIVADEAKRAEFSGVIRRESERLTHLINNVLDLGRIEAGSKRYSLVPTDVVSTVREAVDAYRPLFDRLGFEISVTLPAGPIQLPLDRDAIVQALVNLFQNVIKYSNEQPSVRVSIDADRDSVRIAVADRGIGIAPAEIPRIFEPYYRAAPDGARASGSGLGLSIVQHAVAAHGGRVDVVSTPGHGSTFTLVLPTAPAGVAVVGEPQRVVSAEA